MTAVSAAPHKAVPAEPFVRRMILGAVLASVLVGVMVVSALMQNYQQRHQQAAITVENLAWVLEQSLSGSVGLIDHALLAVSDEAERQGAAGGIDRATFNALIARQNSRLANADGLRATNAEGATEYGIGVIPGVANAVGRDYFMRLRDDPNAGLVTSKPLIGRISGKWAIIFARRLNRPDGAFGGVVFAPVNLESFVKALSVINVGPRGVITLFDGDLSVIARFPEPQGFGSTIGQTIMSPQLRQLIETGSNGGAYVARSTVDQIERLFASRKVANYPLYVSVGLDQKEILASWWSDAISLMVTWVLFTLLIIGLTALMIRGWRQRLVTLRTLEENAELEAKVAARTSDLALSNRQLAALSATDGLTGIANRRRFDEALADEWNRAGRNTQPVALALLDVDLFKNYNDHYGHLQGDDCLRKVAQLLATYARRPGDLAARYGGEEFAVLMPAMDAAAALSVAEAIRGALEAMAMPHATSPLHCVTVSIGIAALVPGQGEPAESLVRQADQALYRAKRQGRNCAVLDRSHGGGDGTSPITHSQA